MTLDELLNTMTEEEKCFTVQLLQIIQDGRGEGPERVAPRRVAVILKALGEDLEQTLNRRTQ